ncbi:MAG: metallophosphoesterase family protein [Anaerolineae bacterium]|nr:metallophosphoesterase family protein [Anaerolineae bacterium]MDQ7033790.1 metallophosphoesterase family protein [Anaerolineae bacterium]
MKIGLISDIHADLDGLEKALKLLRGKNVDKILCAGDLVDRGKDGNAVVERIHEENIPTVQGNHDWMASFNQTYFKKYPERNVTATSLLSEKILQLLENLPRTLTFEFEEREILLAHGSPTAIDEYVHHTATPTQFKHIFREAKTSYIILGHTHIPMVIRMPKWGVIINPGSTFQNFPSPAYPSLNGRSCAILELPYGEVTHYDIMTGEIMPTIHSSIE